MNLLRKAAFLFLILSGLISIEINAQHHPHYSHHKMYRHNTQKGLLANDKLTIMAGIGVASYFGDICDGMNCMKLRPSFGLGGMLRVTDRIGGMIQMNYFRLYAEDVHTERNFSFRSNNGEIFAADFVNMFKYQRYEFRDKKFNPYMFVGVGMFYYAPQGHYKGGWYDLRSVRTEGKEYSPLAPMIPFGVGINFHVGPKLDIQLEGAYRKTFTDYIDNVSAANWIPDAQFATELERGLSNPSGKGDALWVNNPTAVRGNPNRDDWYFMTQVKLKYSVSKKRKVSKNGLHKSKHRK